MSDYEHGAVGSEEETIDKILEEKKGEIKARRAKKTAKPKEEEEEVIYIKEFNLNSMPPFTPKDEKNGVKIVVIGKPGCFAPGTPVLYYDGSVKAVEQVQIGDILMGDDNTPRKVLELYHDSDEMFEIVPHNGTPYTVNRLHSLALKRKGTTDDILRMSVEEYLTKSNGWKLDYFVYRSSGITCWYDEEDIEDPYITGVKLMLDKAQDKSKVLILKKYKVSSETTRFQLLAGIIDTEGSVIDNGYNLRLSLANLSLINDIMFLARSLGFTTSVEGFIPSCKVDIDYYTNLVIKGHRLLEIPTQIVQAKSCNLTSDHLESSFDVIPKGMGEYFGFSLDGNHRFLLASFEAVYNTGKSSLIQDIMASKSHIVACGQIFSGTEDSNHFYSEKFAPCCIFNKLDMDAIKNFVYRQKIAKRFLPNPWAIQIIDDCTDDPSQLRDPIFQAYYKNGRHWNMIHILSLQYSLDILPSIRTNIDYTFILRETNQRNRKALWENYAGCIPNYQMFQDIMDTITEDFTALVINNRVQSNKIEDCVFWYKAKPDRIPPNLKLGHPVSWEFNDARLDPTKTDILIA